MSIPQDASMGGKKTGPFEDLIDVLVSPSTLFERVRQAGFVRPALLQSVIFAVLVLALRNLVSPYFEAEFERGMAKAAESGQAVPEGALAMSRKVAGVGAMVGPVILPWLVAIFGGLATWIGARAVGARLNFGQSATIASWAFTPAILGYVATAVQGALTDATTIRGVTQASLGPARFLDPVTSPDVLRSLLGSLDVFGIWTIVLTAIGVATIARVPRSTGFIAALIRFAIVAVIGMLPSLLRG